MPDLSSELNLALALGSDDTRDYLSGGSPSLRSSLLILDGLFSSVTGHTHQGAHQGGALQFQDLNIGNNLNVVGASDLHGTVHAYSNLQVDGAATLNSTLNVGGVTTLATLTVNQTTHLVGAVQMDTSLAMAGSAGITAGGSIRADGSVSAGAGMPIGPGDLGANRGGSGYVFLADVGHYIGFNGTTYILPTSPLTVGGTISSSADINANANVTVDATNGNVGSVNRTLRLGAGSGEAIGSRRDGGTGSYGIDFYTSSIRRGGFNQAGIFDVGGNRVPITQTTFGWRFDGDYVFLSGGPGVTVMAQSFHAAFAGPPTVIVTMNNISGGRNTYHTVEVAVDSVSANGFNIVFDNNSGGSQSMTLNWLAFGP